MYTKEDSSTYKRALEDITVISKMLICGLKLPLNAEKQEASVSDRQTLGIS